MGLGTMNFKKRSMIFLFFILFMMSSFTPCISAKSMFSQMRKYSKVATLFSFGLLSGKAGIESAKILSRSIDNLNRCIFYGKYPDGSSVVLKERLRYSLYSLPKAAALASISSCCFLFSCKFFKKSLTNLL